MCGISTKRMDIDDIMKQHGIMQLSLTECLAKVSGVRAIRVGKGRFNCIDRHPD